MAGDAQSCDSSLPVVAYSSPFLRSQHDVEKDSKRALVILNSPIRSPPSPLFQRLWDSSSFRVCADGGANRLYRANPELLPNLIIGDLDSLTSEVRTHFESMEVVIEKDPGQDNNDLDKALTALKADDYASVVIYGAFGGRFDQEMASIQALFMWSAHFKHKLVLFDDNTSAILLPAGVKNEIRVPRFGHGPDYGGGLGEGPTCGLIPVGNRCDSVVTTGFKWNLDGTVPLEFGGLVSSSNHVSEEVATVVTSHPLVFTAEVVSGLENTF